MVKKTTKKATTKSTTTKKAPEKKTVAAKKTTASPASVAPMIAEGVSCAKKPCTMTMIGLVLLVINLFMTSYVITTIQGNEEMKVGGVDNYEKLMELYSHDQFAEMQKQQIEGAIQQMDMMSEQAGVLNPQQPGSPEQNVLEIDMPESN